MSTHRAPDQGYASAGAVRQHGGSTLPARQAALDAMIDEALA